MTQGSHPSLPNPRHQSCLLLPPRPQGSAQLLQPLQPHPAPQTSEEFLVRARARRRNSKGQFQRGPARALWVCLRAVLGSGGAPSLWLWDLLEPGLSVQSAWEGLALPQSPGGVLSCLTWPRWGVGSRGWLMLGHFPQNRTPTCCWPQDQ